MLTKLFSNSILSMVPSAAIMYPYDLGRSSGAPLLAASSALAMSSAYAAVAESHVEALNSGIEPTASAKPQMICCGSPVSRKRSIPMIGEMNCFIIHGS